MAGVYCYHLEAILAMLRGVYFTCWCEVLHLSLSALYYQCVSNVLLCLQAGTVRLIWSYHAEDPGPNLAYHGERRGSRSVQLLANYTKPPDLPQDAFNIDFTNPQVTPTSVAVSTPLRHRFFCLTVHSKKKSTSEHLFWCFRLSQIEDSIQFLEGPNSTWKDK